MNCRDARLFAHAYADDELDLVAARRLDLHLRRCPACARVLAVARRVKEATARLGRYPAAHDAPRRVRAACRAECSSVWASLAALAVVFAVRGVQRAVSWCGDDGSEN